MNGEYISLEDAKKIRRYNILLKRIRVLKKENEKLHSVIKEALKINKDLQEHLDKEFWIGRLELQEQILEGDSNE